jgi:hypothetical protein
MRRSPVAGAVAEGAEVKNVGASLATALFFEAKRDVESDAPTFIHSKF